MNDAPHLSPKQARFVTEYLVDCNGSRAAVAAGYGRAGSRVAAHRLLTYANVRAEIEARQGVDARRLQIERQDVIKGLLEAVQVAKERQESAAMVSAWRELGRLMGYYAPERRQIEVSTTAGAEMGRLDRLSDAELVSMINSHH